MRARVLAEGPFASGDALNARWACVDEVEAVPAGRVFRFWGQLKPNIPLLLGLLLASATDVFAAEYVGRVGDIQDGDTFDLETVRIRICGIDAPERGDAGFDAATAALTAIIQGKLVRCVQVGSGTPCDGRSKPTNNGRIVAQCFVGGIDIAKPLVERGFACDWVKFSNAYYSQGGSGKQCQ